MCSQGHNVFVKSAKVRNFNHNKLLYRCVRLLIQKYYVIYLDFVIFVVFLHVYKFVICCDFFPHSK